MCKDCLREQFPQRERTCLDDGSYFMNFDKCKNCNKKGWPPIVNIKRNESKTEDKESKSGDYEETVTYTHTCAKCGHVICEHNYTYGLETDDKSGLQYHKYEMDCQLCGIGEMTQFVGIMKQDQNGTLRAYNKDDEFESKEAKNSQSTNDNKDNNDNSTINNSKKNDGKDKEKKKKKQEEKKIDISNIDQAMKSMMIMSSDVNESKVNDSGNDDDEWEDDD